MKIRIGIIFGGSSREREVSFAGGRTVYDNLNKSIFEPIPLFVDSWGNFVQLNWQFIYKGSIRDFYPPVDALKPLENNVQIYAESLGNLETIEQVELLKSIGKPVTIQEVKKLIDFAFLCLHGAMGEDGKIQGLFEYYGIPYSGSGIFPSAFGIDKAIQKKLMKSAGFPVPAFKTISRSQLSKINFTDLANEIQKNIGFPCVVKPANQGSSIGVSIIKNNNHEDLKNALTKAFFKLNFEVEVWKNKSKEQKLFFLRQITDIREGLGLPLKWNNQIIYHPDTLFKIFENAETDFLLEALDGEKEVIIEAFIKGKEFSCIVIEDENNNAIALPPTEIIKGNDFFDYRSKYLPGLSRKITPIKLENSLLEKIRTECQNLFKVFQFNVYARIDGFINEQGEIFLNDPNTTSGMMPSSFFFHQAAEIGLNPSQFLTFIIRTSIKNRLNFERFSYQFEGLLNKLDKAIFADQNQASAKKKVAVLLGGYSSERHISVESGRNIYEKLSSSEKYEPIPVFLTGNHENHQLFQIPINILLKDNADDIKEKVFNFNRHPIIEKIILECDSIIKKYAHQNNLVKPKALNYADLKEMVDAVFIALHGRPGEDGAVQQMLEHVKLPYNGSRTISSEITIDKYRTNEILMKNGFLAAKHRLVDKIEWQANFQKMLAEIEQNFQYPFIAKPVDDGCSSAVKKIKNREDLIAFTNQIFRPSEELLKAEAEYLNLKPNEEFPFKTVYLIEELISSNGAAHFIEITGGMLSHWKNDSVELEVFEASEALSTGDVLSLEEKFLAGEGQNITPARYALNANERQKISENVKDELGKAAKVLMVEGYCRIDAFVRIFNAEKVEVIFIEVNSLPGMTPATCIFHQTAINGYKPYDFIDKILEFGEIRNSKI